MTYKEIALSFWQYFTTVIIPRFVDMVIVPIYKREALELLIPILITLFLVQIYFGRHKNERIGWNTAFANCIVLLFVTTHLLSYVYGVYRFTGFFTFGSPAFYKTILALCVGLMALFLMGINFFHAVNRKISFFLSSSLFISVISFVITVLVYSNIPFDRDTLFTSLFVLLLMLLFFELFRYVIPPCLPAERYLEKRKRLKHEIRKARLRQIKHRFGDVKEDTQEFFTRFKEWIGWK